MSRFTQPRRTNAVAVLMTCAALTGAVSCTDRANGSARARDNGSAATTSAIDTSAATGPTVIVKLNGVVIDTADRAFRVHLVGRDSVLYMRAPGDSGARVMLYDHGVRTPVGSIVPDYDPKLSAPSVIANAILYWGIHTTNGIDSIRAVRYEFARRRLNPLPIPAKLNRADPAYRFTPPFLDGKEIVFKAPDGEWRFRTPKQ